MDASPHSASSNVTVEYTDPSDLFTSIQPFVSEILPLRNLHWKSPTRPLRSIDSLQVDFIPAQNAAEGQKRLSDGPGSAISRRRHQIPGLRQTPYLKIYLLRCDDNDTYKSTSRKVVREWIKNHASPPQSSSTGNQDNHDAFEYLVIHVLPATATGADPAEKAAPKWPGQRSTSVLEKLKADFNGSSKNAVDRVVQLRLPKSEGPQKSPELSASLEDLVTKLKSGILTSFDLRVSQYEEDIREKDSQRSLPGWNFCTFFILKEGLARGFEHVGLYEDALVGYDELSVGLDAVLRDQLGGVGDQHGGTFLNHTEDIKSKAEKALSEAKEANKGEEASDSSSDDEEDSEGDEEVGVSSSIFPSPISLDLEFFPLEPYKKPYRDMILANNISIFDFRTYIFSRQMVLLLKAAGAPYLREKGSEGQIATTHARRSEDLVLLSEVCERASEFISIGSRTLRHDLEDGMKQLEKSYDASVVSEIINNMVHSWTYGAVSQVLIQTTTNSLDLPKSSILNNRDLVDPSALASFIADTRPGIPKRSSSLSFVPEVNGRPVSEEIMSPDLHNGVQGRDPFATLKRDSTETQKTGTAELSSIRGNLFLFARRTLEKLGRRRGWLESWRNLSLLYDENGHSSGDLEDVPLDRDNEAPGKSSESKEATPLHEGMDIPILLQAGKCRKQFDALYERLSDQIFRHYVAANRTRSAQMVMSDIAVLKYRAGHYSFAASYFHQLIPFYASTQWDVLEGATLEVYGRCLKELGRTDDYVRVMLRLLGQYARGARAGYIIKPQKSKRLSSAAPSSFSATTKFVISKFVDDLFQSSRSLSKELSAPLNDFFGSIYVNPSIRHYKDKDGFQLQLSLRYLLGHEIKIDDARIRLVSVSDSNNEIWLENSQSIVVRSSVTTVSLGSFVSVNGKYTLDRIELRTGNIVFVQSNAAQSSLPPGFRETIADESSDEDERPIIICYPRVDGLSAKVLPSLHIDLGELRTIEFELKSGSNDVRNGTLRVRPATAGLRLRISDMEVVDGFIKLRETTDSGSIEFEDFKPGSSARFSVPFSTEGLQTTLAARLEVSYETPDGNFSYSSTATIDSSLPLSVNVQDMFKEDALFSRFTVSPATITPVRLLNCRVPGSPALDVESSMKQDEILDVFPRQPASLLCKIIQRNSERHKPDGAKYSLALTIEFTCLDEEGLFAVERQFTKDIGSSAFSGLENLLVPHLLEAFRNQWKGSDLEIIGLIREVEVFSYERVQWETMTASLDAQLQKDVTAWLVDWHKKHQILPLSDSKASAPNRQIVIPVDVPDVQVVHTADLTLPNMAGDSVHPIHATVGEMIPAQLNLRHTRRWCPASNREPSSDLEFSYEILTNPEMWLIGGRRRGNYTAKEGETRSFTVMLLPQRSGHLLLPGLEVKTFVLQLVEPRDAFAPSQRKQIHCEVDYRSHAESVLVVPDLRKTTIGLDASGSAGGGSWLVDSERRVGFASS